MKGLISGRGNKPLGVIRLELKLQSELNVTGIQRAGSLSECSVSNLIMGSSACGCQDEVCPVEYVEALSLEFQVYAFRKLESFPQGHVSGKKTRSHECVAA